MKWFGRSCEKAVLFADHTQGSPTCFCSLNFFGKKLGAACLLGNSEAWTSINLIFLVRSPFKWFQKPSSAKAKSKWVRIGCRPKQKTTLGSASDDLVSTYAVGLGSQERLTSLELQVKINDMRQALSSGGHVRVQERNRKMHRQFLLNSLLSDTVTVEIDILL